MTLYLLRHGIAEDGSLASDAERRLTPEGKEKTRAMMQLAARMKLDPPKAIISSKLVRAEETAAIAQEEFASNAHHETTTILSPMTPIDLAIELAAKLSLDYDPIMFVGHDPHLSMLASALVS